MFGIFMRALVVVAGLFLIFVGAQFWLDPVTAAAKMGLIAQGKLGLATLRADNAGAFIAIGLIALTGAVRGDGRYMIAPLVFIVVALTGRVITLLTAGYSAELAPPMVIEAILTVIFASATRAFGRRSG